MEAGAPLVSLRRQIGVGEVTCHVWRKEYAHLGVSEVREQRQPRQEHAKPKRLTAPLSPETHILSDVIRKMA